MEDPIEGVSVSTTSSNTAVKLMPYAIAGVLFVTQAALVAFIVKVIARDWLQVPNFGPWLAWLLFIIGGFAIGVVELHVVHEGEVLTDPLAQFCCWSLRRLHTIGFIINSLMLGSMGASIALKREGYSHREVRSFIAAVLYASVWIPLYLMVPFIR